MPTAPARSPHLVPTFVVASVAAFMVGLDNLVVTTALPSIRGGLHASLGQLEWTVNAYTLTFGVLLIVGAALGERFGRRRILTIGLTVFTAASAAAAVAPNAGTLIAARAVQGVGGALVLPLTLTVLSAAVPPARRGAALGVWGALNGLAVALGPLVGGAVTEFGSWQWIFWLNVPIGVLLIPVAARRLAPHAGNHTRLDLPGVALSGLGLLGIVLGLVRGAGNGWTSAGVLGPISAGFALLAVFVLVEQRVAAPMLPLQLFRSRGFSAANVVALLMSFGMFGSIFLLAQFLQIVQGFSPLGAGLRTLPWTAMPILVAPIAGPLSDRIGGRPLIAAGLALQAVGLGWLALVLSPTVAYGSLVLPFVLSGIGMALFFVPIASVVLGSVRPDQEGLASGTNNAVREIGGVFGVAVLASVFAARGGYGSPVSFSNGIVPALGIGAAVVAVGAVVALALPGRAAQPVPAAMTGPPVLPAVPAPAGV